MMCVGSGGRRVVVDEQLGLVAGKEQGRLREKLALLAVVVPYHQAPQVCQRCWGECHAMTLRRVALREAARLAAGGHHQTLPQREGVGSIWKSMGICVRPASPKRPRRSRVSSWRCWRSRATMAEVSKERHEILHKILQAQITDSEAFRSRFTGSIAMRTVSGQRVIVLADGARWIWTMVETYCRTPCRFSISVMPNNICGMPQRSSMARAQPSSPVG